MLYLGRRGFFLIRLSSALQAGKQAYYFIALLRARRLRARVTQVVVPCVVHIEDNRTFLSLGQRQFGQWEFKSLRALAREFLVDHWDRAQLGLVQTSSEVKHGT